MGLTQLYGRSPSCLGQDWPKRNWVEVGQKELGQQRPKMRVRPMLAQQIFFSFYATGPGPTQPFWSAPELVRPSKQWRDSPLFTCYVNTGEWIIIYCPLFTSKIVEKEDEEEEGGGGGEGRLTWQWCWWCWWRQWQNNGGSRRLWGEDDGCRCNSFFLLYVEA
jgi:hypothetical protein